MRFVAALSLIGAFLAPVLADLPIHCVHDQIFGTWKLSFSKPGKDYDKCGYVSPDSNAHHFMKYDYKLKPVREVTLKVQPPQVQGLNEIDSLGFKGNMKWTTVYDEGIHFSIQDDSGAANAFAFFEYQPKSSGDFGQDAASYVSNCDRTRVGWYHTKDSSGNLLFGCFQGERISGNSTSEGEASLQPKEDMVVSPRSFVNVREPLSKNENLRFNLSYISEVNNNPASTWRAHPHEHLHNKISLADAYQMLGVSRYSKPDHGWDRRTYMHRVAALRRMPQVVSFLESDAVKALPVKFDWRDHIEDLDPVDQGSCGSCFAVSTTMMSTIRRKIAQAKKEGRFMQVSSKEGTKISFDKSDRLAAQDVLNCSPSNQGCEGGYPFLVAWHNYRHGIASSTEVEYLASDLKEACSTKPRVKSAKYYYIGGHYGGATEEALMKDIQENGPATVGIDAPSHLFSYRSGIFPCEATRHEGTNLEDLKPWEATNHAVLAYGWGEENGQKYWLLKNSWGKYWGEDGFFRIPRDNKDRCAITSMPVGMQY